MIRHISSVKGFRALGRFSVSTTVFPDRFQWVGESAIVVNILFLMFDVIILVSDVIPPESSNKKIRDPLAEIL